MPRDSVHVFADESCLGNQFKGRARPGGAGALLEVWHEGSWERRDLWVSEPDTTNNRMALRSAIETLRVLRRRCTVHFTSDSTYLVKGIGEWLPGWVARGWKKSGGPIKNLELWQQLHRLLQRHDVHVHWIKGHAGHPRNEYADLLATTAAKEQTASGGLVTSGFQEWLDTERERGRYLDFHEFLPPES